MKLALREGLLPVVRKVYLRPVLDLRPLEQHLLQPGSALHLPYLVADVLNLSSQAALSAEIHSVITYDGSIRTLHLILYLLCNIKLIQKL